jgi:D-sedoheptulose 7-phosphate isomerase
MSEIIEAYFGNGQQLGLVVSYSRETEPLGTGGAVRLAAQQHKSGRTLVINGDSYCRVDLDRLIREHAGRRAKTSLWLVSVPDSTGYGAVDLRPDGSIYGFYEKLANRASGLINAGVYLLEPDVIDQIPGGKPVSIEKEVFPRLVGHGLYGIIGDGPFVDIGTPSSYATAATTMKEDLFELDRLASREGRLRNVSERLLEASALQKRVGEELPAAITAAADLIVECFSRGGKVMLCGNGGSAADSQHMAAEFVGVLSHDFDRPPMPAIALTTDTSFLTAFANDRGFDGIFERQLQGLGKAGDVLIAISTSGSSTNVVRAVKTATKMGVRTIGLIGEGGLLTQLVDCPVVVPSHSTAHVQEALLPIEHAICSLVERALFKGNQ